MSRSASLIFDWPRRHTLYIALPLAILFAAILHGGVFYIFSIVYPRPEVDSREAAQVYFVPAGRTRDAYLMAFLHTADPALFGPGRGLKRDEATTSVDYTPQYDTQKILLDLLPPNSLEARAKPKRYGAVPLPILSRVGKRNSSFLGTQLSSMEPLAKRLPALPKTERFQAPPGQSLEPAVFLVGVRGNGSVAYVILQRGSGNTQLDEKALKMLRSLQFGPSSTDMEWGMVSFMWGADVQFIEMP